MDRENILNYCLLAVIAAVVVFTNLGGVPLLDPDEPVYAETPLEMILNSDYISPRIYGDFWYDKPPMYYWLVAAAYKLFGVNEFAARFPSALLSVGGVLMLFGFAKRLFNTRTAWISSLILLSSLEYFYLGKAAVTDITLNFFLMGSLLSFISKKYYAFYAFAALATVTKGPVGLFFPVVIGGSYLLLTRNLHELAKMKLGVGSLIYLIIAVPWYACMYQLHGADFINTFLGFHNVTRFTTPEHPSGTLWFYYVPVLIIGFLPWLAGLFPAVKKALNDGRENSERLLFLIIWMVIVFLFFTAAQTKLVSYILPMYPAMALLVGWYVDHIASSYYNEDRQYTLGIGAFVLFAALAYGVLQGLPQLPQAVTGIYLLSICLVISGIAGLIMMWKRDIIVMVYTYTVGMIVASLIIFSAVVPHAAPLFSSQLLAAEFKTVYDGSSQVYVSKFLRPGFAFYTKGTYGIELEFSPARQPDMKAVLDRNEKAYFVLRDMDYKRIDNNEKTRLEILKQLSNTMIVIKK